MMMQWKRLMPYVAGVAVCLAVMGVMRTPNKVSAAVRAALVEVVIPSQPWSGSLITVNEPVVMGPGATTETLGVTNLVLTNFDTSAQQVYIFQSIQSGLGCYNSTIAGGTGQGMTVYLQPHATLSIPYPTPWKFAPVSGYTCIGAEVTTTLHGGSVEMDVNGFLN